MNIYWLIGIAFVIFWVAALIVEEMRGDAGNKDVAISCTVGVLASILFVLIMIYDKL